MSQFYKVIPHDTSNHEARPLLDSTLSWMIHVNSKLTGDDIQGSCQRTVSFMAFELAMLTQGQTSLQLLQSLHQFFFTTKRFKFALRPFLLKDVLRERTGCGISLALLYIYLAEAIGIKLDLVHWPLHSVLKWNNENRPYYLDLEQHGKILDEDDLLKMINEHKEQVKTLSIKESILQYLDYITMQYRQSQELNELHTALGLQLESEPENTRYLVERALLRKDLGMSKESLADFKRLFAFIEKDKADPRVLSAYLELKELLNSEHNVLR